MSAAYALAHRQAGLCVSCHRKAAPGRLRCQEHLAYHRERQAARRKERIALGLCPICGRPALEREAPDGDWRKLQLCIRHHAAQLLATRRSTLRKKAAQRAADVAELAANLREQLVGG